VGVVGACATLPRHSRQQLAGIHLGFPSSSLNKFGMGKEGSPMTNVGDGQRNEFHDRDRVLYNVIGHCLKDEMQVFTNEIR